MKNPGLLIAGTMAFLALAACRQELSLSQDPTPDLAELRAGFENPPNEARPRVWWHWMNGNVTQDGITKDLEWMEKSGIGGFQNFDASLGTPVVVDEKLVFMTPPWKAAFKHATDLADEKGMEMTIAGSPGWSVTGGPWVEPRDGMKKYVWSETVVEGGSTFDGKLPEPPKETSTFQNHPPERGLSPEETDRELPEFYADAAVVAYRMPDHEVSMADLNPEVSSSGGSFSLGALTDGDLHNGNFLPPGEVGGKTWVQYDFGKPVTFKAYSVVGATITQLAVFRGMPENRSLEVSDDGRNFRKVADLPGNIVPQTSGTFPETTARYWRFVYKTLPPAPTGLAALMGNVGDLKPEGVNVDEFVLYNTDRIDSFEDKAGFSAWKETGVLNTEEASDPIDRDGVVDLTGQFKEDGSLTWEVPEGRWRIIRLGYSLTGRENHPASPEATGLEVDKLDGDAVRRYINYYLDLYKDATGGKMGATGLGYIILDSYEAGHMNWTHDMFDEFEQRRGYSMKPWLPVLTGRVVQSRGASEKFLWDFRKTIGEMISDNHYDVIGEELKKRGMGRYTESHEGGRIYLADGMDVKRHADVPMSAMWTPGGLSPGPDEEVRSEGDIRESASVANIYGKPYVAAESMTSIQNAFTWHPGKLKRTADMELASGLNRYVIHTSVHQPLDDKMPGFTLGPFGQYFTRQETWASQARAWVDYLARGSYMMQQGRNVADILYYYGENQNVTWLTRESLPDLPEGYEFDFANATALQEAISVEDGRLKARSGNTYEILVLDGSAREMRLSVLRRLKELLDAGIHMAGTAPEGSPSLSDDPDEVSQLVDAVANHPNFHGRDVEGAMAQLGLNPDVIVRADNAMRYRHRRAGDLDIYWLNNRSAAPGEAKVSFRVGGKVPELWDPQTGTSQPLSYRMSDNRTEVDLEMEPWGAVFVVFSGTTDTDAVTLPETSEETLLALEGPWDIDFQPGRGAPASIQMDRLISWSDHTEEGVKYFSGTATYTRTFEAPEISEGSSVWLDLGEVHNLAEVLLNGQSLGVIWKTPYRVAITDALQQGSNRLEIRVTNTWVNRLIRDAQPDVKEKITFTTMPFYQGNEPLLPAGLLGPVKLVEKK